MSTYDADDWHLVREFNKAKRHELSRRNLEWLIKQELSFTYTASNFQALIKTPIGLIDFWTSTGTWKVRATNRRGRGSNTLQKYIETNGGTRNA